MGWVELQGVYAGYGGPDVLRGVDARIPEGAVTALVGANGSGKSTLLGVLAGTLEPRAGTVTRQGGSRPAFVVQRSAVQDALPLTVRTAVAMGRWAHRGLWRPLTRRDRAVVRECLDRMGVADLAGRQLGELSGGQRQRVLVAQGLAQEAGLLLLDEPSAGLDRHALEYIRATVDRVRAEGVTVVHATHAPEEALGADHCLVMEGGAVAASGPPEEAARAWGGVRR
ncbi:zinc/manganese transport system ATP-binding protein [Nocardiopsis sp. Huas11]|uniref:zinc ABC transporter ATP-binding protein AztA n=1 Tax=Nocardiopsis sp. Huas11 TaxID=2183912 RepID=UPI000EAE153D|nr:zinc ABC transporter ATP-binding protein AztA [Nocardiopsis sp. Huas11]RKS08078.1 zinc/manganese transport system ATP-binding protein [Nocardiopsis sp. Huas11]